jgi:hypothetical protein
MNAGRLFCVANLYLLMAGLLSGALLFAPLAYASNFPAKIHASVYGLWVVVDKDMGSGVNLVTPLGLASLPFHFPYAVTGLVSALGLSGLVFYNRDLERKQKGVFYLLVVVIAQLVSAVVIRMLALQHVGGTGYGSGIESGFQREFVLLFFVLYFLWRCIRRLRRMRQALRKAQFQGLS